MLSRTELCEKDCRESRTQPVTVANVKQESEESSSEFDMSSQEVDISNIVKDEPNDEIDIEENIVQLEEENIEQIEKSTNTVQQLRRTAFCDLTIEEKMKIKNEGRPLPSINLNQACSSQYSTINRQFIADIYDKYKWICGCEVTNRLFCFPCIMFSSRKDLMWTGYGCGDFEQLTKKIKSHENSKAHIYAVREYASLDTSYLVQITNRACPQPVQPKGTSNRYILLRVIKSIKFCSAFNLAPEEPDNVENSLHCGILNGLLDFSSQVDPKLKDHLEKSSLKGVPKEMQNDILQCMLKVYQEEIKSEVQKADYISIIVYETTDISSQFQIVVVLRYVLPDGKPVERFWTILNPVCGDPLCDDATSFSNCLTESLVGVISDKNKVISQSYYGGSVIGKSYFEIQANIKQTYPYAHSVHYYAYELDMFISHICSKNREIGIFFADLSEIQTFFSNLSERCETMMRHVPNDWKSKWNSLTETVFLVFVNKESLLETLERIEDTSMQNSTIAEARGLLLKITQPMFQFWLKIFHSILPHVDSLYKSLKRKPATSVSVKTAIDSFENILHTLGDFEDCKPEVPEYVEMRGKRQRVDCYEARNIAANELYNLIISQVKECFSFKGHITAGYLLASENFPTFKQRFPETLFQECCDIYPLIDRANLKTELQVLYMRNDFRIVSGISPLLEFIIENNVQSIFSETCKMLKALLTTPMMTDDNVKCFSTLKNIKNVLHHRKSQERLTALSMLSAEKEFVKNISRYNTRVIEALSRKNSSVYELQA